ncbi:hypothetical protein RF11_02222 [Thelohanellus kitauei]|uniref:Uncharacterized protein n=1 Tax=Thelohanellus kitauei TaxID=669202 RepID=A0A0C2IDK7_THEKT|nr:hypothetical protein RF11_02222 [Thelohanellus kitauei]
MPYFETSALTNTNIEESFMELARIIASKSLPQQPKEPEPEKIDLQSPRYPKELANCPLHDRIPARHPSVCTVSESARLALAKVSPIFPMPFRTTVLKWHFSCWEVSNNYIQPPRIVLVPLKK